MALLLATAGPGLAAIPAASTGAQSTIGKLGSRPGATRLPLPINDQVSGSVDVGTGNLMLSITGLSLPGINGDTPLGVVFNSQSTDTTNSAGPRWNLAAGAAGTLSSTSSGVLYTAGDGYSALFTPVAGSTTAFTSPPGVKADLVKSASDYKLTSRTSATVVTFNLDGRTKLVEDRNGNDTTYGPLTGKITTVTSHKGPLGARSATLTYDSLGDLSGFTQTSGTSTRAVSFTRDGAGNLESFTDFAGKTTDFAYTNSRITTITPPTGGATTITYDTNGKVTRITRANASSGSPGSSVTRIAYPSATQTLVAGPNTDLAVAVATGPRTTYALTTDGRVNQATDPEGRIRSGTYTGDFDTLTATQGTGTTSGTTTNTFGANTGESVTKSQSQTGASSQAAYGNTAANTKYLATSSTDDAGNQSLYTYNGAGNALTSSDALAAVATLTSNPNLDGTVTEALAPGNGTNKTKYVYNTDKQLSTLTPVTGTSLGARAFTYDEWARPKTATNGRGITLTYTYDAVGRLTGTTFSGTTPAVSYTYNDNGQPLTRVDANGTTTFTYDQMGRLTSRVNTAGGGTISYGYDKASNLVSTTDSRGTTTYTFDTSGVMETLVYLIEGVQKTLAVATDDRGRRTDTWLQASPARTAWKAKSHTDYDRSGRVTRVTAKSGEGDTDNTTVMDLSYCYAAGSTAPTCSTTATADRSKIQWVKDNISGAVTTYTYDAAGRLSKAVVTGSAPATYTYTYDSRGNRLTANGGTVNNQSFTVNAANQITSTNYTYDGAGNLTKDQNGNYAYNGADQMTSITKGGTTHNYTYAGTSQTEVLSQNTPEGNYQITYGRTDAQGLPIIEQYKKDTLTAYVEHDPITGEPLMLRTSSGMQSLYLYDGTGNPAALVTSTPTTAFSYDYDPYGVALLNENSGGLGTSQNPYTFKAGIKDRTTDWVKYGQRWYDPTTGRWTQQDTLDAPLDPKNANRYAYAANDPINNSDPKGLSIEGEVFGFIVGGIVQAGFGLLVTGAAAGAGPLAPVIGGAVGGCAGGAVQDGAQAAFDGEDFSAQDALDGCLEDGLTGIGAGAGKSVLDIFK